MARRRDKLTDRRNARSSGTGSGDQRLGLGGGLAARPRTPASEAQGGRRRLSVMVFDWSRTRLDVMPSRPRSAHPPRRPAAGGEAVGAAPLRGLSLSPDTRLALFVAVLTLAKLVVAAWTPLASDEALYWRYSKHLAAGFIDHPFVNPLMIRIGTGLFGDTPLGVRVLPVLLGLPASWALGRAAYLLSEDAGLARSAVVYFNLTLVMSLGAMVATSDQAVVAATCLLLLCVAQLHRSGRGAWWLAVGAAFGLGLCCKYTTAFFAVSLLAWVLAVREQRRWLLTPWPWAGGLVALAVFSPVLAWNAQHQWASLVYQSGRLTVFVWTLRYLGELACALLILATPPIFVLGCAGLGGAGARPGDSPARALLVSMCAPMMVYFVWHATHERVQGNWPEPIYPAFAIAAAYASRRPPARPGWLAALVKGCRAVAVPFGVAVALLAYAEATTGFLPLGPHDPRTRVLGIGWRELAAEVDRLRARTGAGVILTTDYTTASLTQLYLPSHTPVVEITERMRWTNEPAPPASLFQGASLYVCKNACSKLGKVRARFAEVQPLAVLRQDSRANAGAWYHVFRLGRPTAPVLDPASRIYGADHEDR